MIRTRSSVLSAAVVIVALGVSLVNGTDTAAAQIPLLGVKLPEVDDLPSTPRVPIRRSVDRIKRTVDRTTSPRGGGGSSGGGGYQGGGGSSGGGSSGGGGSGTSGGMSGNGGGDGSEGSPSGSPSDGSTDDSESGDEGDDDEAEDDEDGVLGTRFDSIRKLVLAWCGCLDRLNRKERDVLVLRHGYGPGPPRSRRTVARATGLSYARVAAIERRGVSRLVAAAEDAPCRRNDFTWVDAHEVVGRAGLLEDRQEVQGASASSQSGAPVIGTPFGRITATPGNPAFLALLAVTAGAMAWIVRKFLRELL